MKAWIFFVIFFLTLTSVSAYSNATLKHYMTFGDGISETIYDSRNGYVFINALCSGSCISKVLNTTSGINGNALWYEEKQSVYKIMSGSATGENLPNDYGNNNSWSINFWMNSKYISQTESSQPQYTLFGFSIYPALSVWQNNNMRGFIFNKNTTGTTSLSEYRYLTGSSWVLLKTFNTPMLHNTWHMVTITLNASENIVRVYLDSVFIDSYNNTQNDWAYNSTFLRFPSLSNRTLDEYSVWHSAVLSQDDITFLYNGGNSLNYFQTMAQTNTTALNYTWYSDFCFDAVTLCHYGYYDDALSSFACPEANMEECDISCVPDSTAYCQLDINDIGMLSNNTIRSKNQCIGTDGVTDFYCSETYYDNETNVYYCNADNVSRCSPSCNTLLVDVTTGTTMIKPYSKSCSDFTQSVLGSIRYYCSRSLTIFGESYELPSLIFPIGACNIAYGYINIPKGLCSDTEYDQYITDNPTHEIYSEGQCYNETAFGDLCVLGDRICNSQTSYAICINTSSGGTVYNSTNCPSGEVCSGGSCIVASAICWSDNDCSEGLVCDANQRCVNSSSSGISAGYKLMIGLILMLSVFLLFFLPSISFGMMKFGFIAGVVGALFVMICASIKAFPVIGGTIPAWIVFVIALISILLSVIIVASGSGGQDG
jgi:hypothetical protein